MVDVIITTRNRLEFLQVTVNTLFDLNKTVPYRVIIYDDCSDDGTTAYLRELDHDNLQAVILGKQRMGVVYGFDQAWAFSEQLHSFYSEAPFLCYLQDDVQSVAGEWLLLLLRAYEDLANSHEIGFLSGCDAPEHPVVRELFWDGRRVALKKSEAAQNLFAPRSFWQSIGFIPRLNPDGSERGFPGDGKGSHIDLYLTGCMSESRFVENAAAENCLYNQQKNVLVVPGLLRHLGKSKEDSTWRGTRI